MKDSTNRQAWRIGLVAALLPMALGSAAQGGLKWQGAAAPVPDSVRRSFAVNSPPVTSRT